MQDRSEIFRRIKQQYFREQLAPLGFQPMDGMILYLLWGGNCLRQEDIAAQTALDQAQLNVRQAQLAYHDLAAAQRPAASLAGVVQQVHVQRGDQV